MQKLSVKKKKNLKSLVYRSGTGTTRLLVGHKIFVPSE